MEQKIEYRVRPVTRYYVTRWYQGAAASGCDGLGEFDSEQTAYEVGYALAKAEHDRLGWPPGDERMRYPSHPNLSAADLRSAESPIT
jgi:hypothetical protein